MLIEQSVVIISNHIPILVGCLSMIFSAGKEVILLERFVHCRCR